MTIHGNFQPQIVTDFGDKTQSTINSQYTAALGTTALRNVTRQADGTLTAIVPAELAPGTYDLVVIDPRGTQGTLARAFQVLAPGTLAQTVASYDFATLSAQQAFSPFFVMISALDSQGNVATSFSGSVTLSELTGTAVPATLGYFAYGSWSGLVEIRQPIASDSLSVVDGQGHAGTSNTFAVTSRPVTSLVFTTPVRTLIAGACSPPITIGLSDDQGNAVVSAATLPLTLSSTSPLGFRLFADATCVTLLTPSISALAAGQQGFTFFAQGPRSGTALVDASTTGLTGATQLETIDPGGPAQIGFLTASQQVDAGACSATTTVELRDALGNPVAPSASVGVTLLASPDAGFAFFQDSACQAGNASATISQGMAETSFWFSGTQAGSISLTAQAIGLDAGTQTEVVTPLGPSQLVFISAPQSITAGACSVPAVVQPQDVYGNPSAPLASTTVLLNASPDAGFTFFGGPGCTGPTSSFPLLAGQPDATFNFGGTVAAFVSVGVTVAGWTGSTQLETLQPAPASQLVFVTAPQSLDAGQCSSVATLQTEDPYGNPAPVTSMPVTLAAAPDAGVGFFSDPGCTAMTTVLGIPDGGSAASFWFDSTVAEPFAATASALGLAPALQNELVTPGPPAGIVFITAPQIVPAGSCSAQAYVQAIDAFGNPSPMPASPVGLISSPDAGFSFYLDPVCALPTTSTGFDAGDTVAGFFFESSQRGPVGLTANATAGSAQQTEVIDAGLPASFVIGPIPSLEQEQVPLNLNIQTLDMFGLPTPYIGTATLSLTPSETLTCTSNCTDSVTTAAFVNGVWSGQATPGSPAGTNRRLMAVSGTVSGASNPFDVASSPTRSPPLAVFTFGPAVVVLDAGTASITFDSSDSTDIQTPQPALLASWDFTGSASGTPAPPPATPALPWSPWAPLGALDGGYSSTGTFHPRLAVVDTDNDIGYATATVSVLNSASAANLCVVNTNTDVDTGAGTCSGSVSLRAALRLANAAGSPQTVTFNGPMTIVASSSPYSITAPMNVLAPSGVSLDGGSLSVSGSGVTIAGMELDNNSVSVSGDLALFDSLFQGSSMVLTGGATLTRVHMLECPTTCLDDNGNGTLSVAYSEFRNSTVGGAGISAQCTASGLGLDVWSTVFEGFGTGLSFSCNTGLLGSPNGTARARYATFEENDTGASFNLTSIALLGQHSSASLTNAIFARSTTAAGSCSANSSVTASDFFLNASNGTCGSGSSYDPQFVSEVQNDFRLRGPPVGGSPAINSGSDTTVNVNAAAPGNYLGTGPDVGARETY